jgi:hypothetical protein
MNQVLLLQGKRRAKELKNSVQGKILIANRLIHSSCVAIGKNYLAEE